MDTLSHLLDLAVNSSLPEAGVLQSAFRDGRVPSVRYSATVGFVNALVDQQLLDAALAQEYVDEVHTLIGSPDVPAPVYHMTEATPDDGFTVDDTPVPTTPEGFEELENDN